MAVKLQDIHAKMVAWHSAPVVTVLRMQILGGFDGGRYLDCTALYGCSCENRKLSCMQATEISCPLRTSQCPKLRPLKTVQSSGFLRGGIQSFGVWRWNWNATRLSGFKFQTTSWATALLDALDSMFHSLLNRPNRGKPFRTSHGVTPTTNYKNIYLTDIGPPNSWHP